VGSKAGNKLGKFLPVIFSKQKIPSGNDGKNERVYTIRVILNKCLNHSLGGAELEITLLKKIF